MKITNSVITFFRGDDDGLLVRLEAGAVFAAGDKVFFCLRANETDTTDIFQIESTEFVPVENVANAGAMIRIPHEQTITRELATYYYTIWIQWENGDYVTIVPPTKFILSAGGSHNGS